MAQIDDIMMAAERAVMQHLGETVTYIPVSGTPVIITALLTESLQNDPTGYASETWMQHIIIEMLVADVAQPMRGDKIITAQNITYTVDTVTGNDGYVVKCVVL